MRTSNLVSEAQLPQRETAAASRPVASVCNLVASHATVAPDRLAVIDRTTRLTYAELERKSNQLAAHLLEAGAGPGCCVGLFLERSPHFVVAAEAVLKTGAAYLPLDLATPGDRAAFILADAGTSMVLTHRRETQDLLAGPWRVIELDGHDAARITTRPATPILVEPTPDSLAYVIYTSGSTGRPKGVEITHANLCNLIEWHVTAFGVTPADQASQVAGLGFDAAAWEIWPHLAAGVSLHIADELTRRSPQLLRDWLVAERITISFVPTVLAEQLLHAAWPQETALRTLLTGADTLQRRPAGGLPFTLVNNYGPTECTVVATSGTVAPHGDEHSQPSIGQPIANTTALILDDALRPVPPGEPGELCLAGALVGRGYRNNPELTARHFVMVAPDSGPPQRVYRTGDRVRLLASGEIAFLGRLDDQVKIRGYRVEPGEVVAWLNRYPGIEASAVVLRNATRDESAAGIDLAGSEAGPGPRLVAYVVVADAATFSAEEIREFLATRLSDYMIPASFVKIASLPMTSNGKLDRSALPPPVADNLLAGQTTRAVSPLAGGLQQQIAAQVALMLNRPSVDVGEDIFLIGGHSMLAMQLVSQIHQMFGVNLALRQLFSEPTVAALSAEVARLIETPVPGEERS